MALAEADTSAFVQRFKALPDDVSEKIQLLYEDIITNDLHEAVSAAKDTALLIYPSFWFHGLVFRVERWNMLLKYEPWQARTIVSEGVALIRDLTHDGLHQIAAALKNVLDYNSVVEFEYRAEFEPEVELYLHTDLEWMEDSSESEESEAMEED